MTLSEYYPSVSSIVVTITEVWTGGSYTSRKEGDQVISLTPSDILDTFVQCGNDLCDPSSHRRGYDLTEDIANAVRLHLTSYTCTHTCHGVELDGSDCSIMITFHISVQYL